jgi:hypothetical protein
MALSKEDLMKTRFGVEEVALPGVGTVKVRSLSRAQALELRDKEMPVAEMEQKLLAWAMVEPAMTISDVKEWQANSPAGELEPITKAIAQLSGMEASAPKKAMRDFRGNA